MAFHLTLKHFCFFCRFTHIIPWWCQDAAGSSSESQEAVRVWPDVHPAVLVKCTQPSQSQHLKLPLLLFLFTSTKSRGFIIKLNDFKIIINLILWLHLYSGRCLAAWSQSAHSLQVEGAMTPYCTVCYWT